MDSKRQNIDNKNYSPKLKKYKGTDDINLYPGLARQAMNSIQPEEKKFFDNDDTTENCCSCCNDIVTDGIVLSSLSSLCSEIKLDFPQSFNECVGSSGPLDHRYYYNGEDILGQTKGSQ